MIFETSLIDTTLIVFCLEIVMGVEKVMYIVVVNPLVPLLKGVQMNLIKE